MSLTNAENGTTGEVKWKIIIKYHLDMFTVKRYGSGAYLYWDAMLYSAFSHQKMCLMAPNNFHCKTNRLQSPNGGSNDCRRSPFS